MSYHTYRLHEIVKPRHYIRSTVAHQRKCPSDKQKRVLSSFSCKMGVKLWTQKYPALFRNADMKDNRKSMQNFLRSPVELIGSLEIGELSSHSLCEQAQDYTIGPNAAA